MLVMGLGRVWGQYLNILVGRRSSFIRFSEVVESFEADDLNFFEIRKHMRDPSKILFRPNFATQLPVDTLMPSSPSL